MSNLLIASAAIIFRALNMNQLRTIFFKDESPLYDLIQIENFVRKILMICIIYCPNSIFLNSFRVSTMGNKLHSIVE